MRPYVLALAMASAAFAQQAIPLWPGIAPGSERWTHQEVVYKNDRTGETMIRNVVTPTLTAYLPDRAKATGTAVIVAPGGGFRFLSWDSEGVLIAKWLAARGVAAFVLKYRVAETPASDDEFRKSIASLMAAVSGRGGGAGRGSPNSTMPEIQKLANADTRQAVKLVRHRASEWGIQPDRIVLMGFSAGAIATVNVIMEHDADSRPNYAAPIYGGATNDKPLPSDAPPLFILVANDDRLMAPWSLKLYTDWRAANLPVEYHVYSKGGHGFGLTPHGLPVDHWIDLFGGWLEVQGLMKASSK